LKGLTGVSALILKDCPLNDTKITDAGLTHLSGLTRLWKLNTAGTRVTDAGVQEFRQALPKVRITR
jgi:hypothetical protein